MPLTNGRCVEVEVRAVEFIHQLPEKRAEVGLEVTAAIRAGEVAVDENCTRRVVGERSRSRDDRDCA